MSEARGRMVGDSEITLLTKEERETLNGWAEAVLKGEKSPLAPNSYFASLRVVRYEDALLAGEGALAEMTRERDAYKRQARALTCQRDGLLERVGAEAEMAPCPECPLEDLCHVPEEGEG